MTEPIVLHCFTFELNSNCRFHGLVVNKINKRTSSQISDFTPSEYSQNFEPSGKPL